ncbi:hypothetical protein ACH5RR_018142 [Cinchona calisaya]|uniref:START domain-containing protein n=1 Tax=Cinchona calisaya TaxID=153742 RepID=A0ABD2ZQN9_9GENT
MEELIKMVQIEFPLWISTMDDRKYFLNKDAYYNMLSKVIELKPAGFNIEASKETDIALMNCINLVEVFMDMDKWFSIFANIISRGLVLEITWVEHVILQDEGDNYFGKLFVELSLAFGAQKWLSILARQCERLTGEMKLNFSLDDIDTVLITPEGRKNILKVANSSQGNMLKLQKCFTHPIDSYIVYALVDEVSINLLLDGGNPNHVALLPSGFTIYPCGPIPTLNYDTTADKVARNVGSLVTVAF